ncbi:Eco57I restriction-modification methylase domain-containing protein [Mitsuokella multacida]|uniref:Eco57I restriction-modification methylase domain-containing protein n=1 Tax=Mitsuokella multacida TaxID=52226 RepID=UPI003F604CBB
MMTENNQKKKLFLDTLTSAYNHKEYVRFLQELLNDVHLVAPETFNKEYSSLSAVIEGHYHIGNYKGPDGKKIALFAVQLQNKGNVENARSTQRAFIKSLLDNSGYDSALAAFYTMEKDREGRERPSDKWRLSLIRIEYGFAEGKLSTKLTPAKRYSYLVGKDEPCHTAQERLYGMFVQDEVDPSLNDLEEAFSVETVTKQFFNDYKEKYLAVKEYLEATSDFMAEAERCGFTSEQFTKKLMGQIVFLYFIQKKGWLGVQAFPVRLTEKEYKNALFRNTKAHKLIEKVYSQPDSNGISHINQKSLFALSDEDTKFVSTLVKGKAWGEGPKNFMRALYESCVRRGKNYFDDYLEPLFYEALNVNRGESGFYARFHCRIPFLNGGLFEQLDNYDWVNSDFHIPNSMFSNADTKGKDDADGILDIFDRYNFTMAEDEPMEREVAIDPEMLGKVFENLLDVKDRKSKGAFYTPREIVHYMCQESLINYLSTSTGIESEDIRKFILYGEYFRDNDCLKTKEVYKDGKRAYVIDKNREMEMPESIFSFRTNVNRLKEIDDLLENVKIADPAVGSGAFLLGLLNEIVRARQTLTTYMAIEMNGFQRLNFYSYGRKTYDLKVNTIKNCLFACDLEPSATDITKLRLWLSIVIDDETVKQDDSNGMFDAHTEPRQLPNLDCNVICGNSLMDEFEGISLITESSLLNNQKEVGMESFYQAGFDNMLCELIRLQNDLYFTTDHESKRVIKEKIQNIYDKIILHQLDSNPDAIKAYYQIKNKESKPFVLWQLYFPKVFKEKQGFDIVIGNPPYGLINKKQNQNTSISANKYEIEVYKKKNIYKPAKGGIINIFRLFVCKSFDLLRDNGHLSLIFPMAFMCDLSAKSLREYILNNNKIDYIEAFPERDDENKRVFRSAKMSVCILGASKTHVDGNTKFPMRISRNPFVDLTADIAYISKNDIIKIDEKSLTIPIVSPKEFSILIKICDGGKRLKSYSKCYTGEIDLSLNKKYIRLDSKYATMVRGAQIQKFYVTNEISQGDIYYLDEEAYLSENNAKKSHHHEIPRIVMQGITGVNEKDRLKMTILKAGVYCANSVNYILIKERIYYFLGICNSKVLNWFFSKLSTNSNVNGYEVDNLPIKFGEDDICDEIEYRVKILLDHPDDEEEMSAIDALAYKIYGITNEEREIIEG